MADEWDQGSEEDPDVPQGFTQPIAMVAGLRESYGAVGGTHRHTAGSFQLDELFTPLRESNGVTNRRLLLDRLE